MTEKLLHNFNRYLARRITSMEEQRQLNVGTPPGAAPINTEANALCLCFGCEFCADEQHTVSDHGPSKTGNQLCAQCEQAILEWNIAWDDEARKTEERQRNLGRALHDMRNKKVVDLTKEEIDLFLQHPDYFRCLLPGAV